MTEARPQTMIDKKILIRNLDFAATCASRRFPAYDSDSFVSEAGDPTTDLNTSFARPLESALQAFQAMKFETQISLDVAASTLKSSGFDHKYFTMLMRVLEDDRKTMDRQGRNFDGKKIFELVAEVGKSILPEDWRKAEALIQQTDRLGAVAKQLEDAKHIDRNDAHSGVPKTANPEDKKIGGL